MSCARCRFCRAAIFWAALTTGRRVALDPKVNPAGTVTLQARGPQLPLATVHHQVVPPEQLRRFVLHVTTCTRRPERRQEEA